MSITLFVSCTYIREMYPTLLRKADRGKFHDESHISAEYGHVRVADGVEGVELLEAFEKGEIKIGEDGNLIISSVIMVIGNFY